MSTSNTCPKCGYTNLPNARFCANCATQLAASLPSYQGPQQPPNISPAQWYGSPPGYWNPVETARKTNIDRTKTGLLLVIAGILLGPLPYIMYVGLILAIIGVILVIIGRNPFGNNHSNYTIFSVVIYCVGIAVAFVVGFLFGLSFVSAALSGGSQTAIEQALVSAFNELLIGVLISGAVIGIAYVIFTYALQDSMGRVLLYIAFAIQLAVSVTVAYIVSPQVLGAVTQSFSSGTFDPSPLSALQAQLQFLRLLGLIPAAIFAFAYYRAYSRIAKGEVPAAATPLASFTPSSGSG
ncbi:zinc ribbon domain-containing protein [Candidatus Bathyarchaeota archaeon]|nr:MAG: zinc ribbon domain-containing protein [Candidatus Bathyarchaeota archaeon]TMI60099.1 MAG: zinc ribbon domain-containing protein [Candidatus Bathyarchaeota archaeon]